MHTLPSATRLIHLWRERYNTGGSGSMAISSLRFTGQCFEGTGLLDFRQCSIRGLMTDYMILEIRLNGTSQWPCYPSKSNKSSVLSFVSYLFPLFNGRWMHGFISETGPMLRHGRDVHPTWVRFLPMTLESKMRGVLCRRLRSEEGLR